MNDGTPLNRVLMIGCANVTAAEAYSFLRNESVGELVLIGEGGELLLEEVLILRKTLPSALHFGNVYAGDYPESADAAGVAVIAAGERARAGETRFELLKRNAALVRRITRELVAANFGGVILVTTNPADVLAQIALEESGLPSGKVIGSGNLLDASRLNEVIFEVTASECDPVPALEPESIDAPAAWCAAQIGGAPFVDFCTADCPDFGKMMVQIKSVAAARETNGLETGASPQQQRTTPVGSCVTKICEAILRDEKLVLPLSVMANGQYGISGVYLSLPCIVGREGVERVIEPPPAIYQMERKRLERAAILLKQTLEDLKDAAVSAIAA